MEFDKTLFDWLQTLGVMTVDDAEYDPRIEKYVTLPATTNHWENGVNVMKTLRNVVSKYPEVYKGKYIPTQEALKLANNPSSSMFNWNYIADVLKKMEVIFDKDIKGLILAGDHEILVDLLKQVKAIYTKCEFKADKGKKEPTQIQILRQEKARELDLANFDVNKTLNKTTNLPEFFLLSICKHMELTAQQVSKSLFAFTYT
jgi:hypothetical protein